MTDASDRNRPPVSPAPDQSTDDASDPALRTNVPFVPNEPEPDPHAFDANGFDPAEFEWRPVARRRRVDGWTPEVQRRFIEALAETALVSKACQAVDMSVQSAYRLRRAANGAGFARAWDAATSAAATRLIDVAFSRAIEGVDVPVFDRDGNRIGAKWQYSDRLMMFLLRAYRPDQFRHAERDTRRPDEPLPRAQPLAPALDALAPVTPAAPQLTMEPEALASAVENARAVAEVYDLYPVDERERYVRPRVEPNHPAAVARGVARRVREDEREVDHEDYRQDDREYDGEV